MIDRRQLLTGIAAVAAATALPALPATAKPIAVPFGRIFRFDTRIKNFDEEISREALGAIWQFQPWDCWTSTIRHCASGLTFATDIRHNELYTISMEHSAPVDERVFYVVGHAADYATNIARPCRWKHEGAFYYAYRGNLPDGMRTADAPTLPRLVRP